MRAIVFLLGVIVVSGCAADAVPLEADVVVESAGLAAPVRAGTECVLRMQPAWRQGVNCQVLLRCTTPGGEEEDLFGGRRVGGYAVCDTADGAFTTALDEEPRNDGDPAVDVDLLEGTIAWRGPRAGQEATLRIESPSRLAATW